MAAVPAATPVTTPELLTVAIDELLLPHVPPVVVSAKVAVAPAQTVAPLIDVGNGLTVTIWVTVPQEVIYEITEVPELTPVTTPLVLLTVAIPVSPELHVPPVTASLNPVVEPTHTLPVPVIADGTGLTITLAVVEPPPLNE